jgi:predicted nucleotidyltransferase component of viral defense system
LPDSPTREELLEVQEFFGLPSPALVEKDFHVVRALAAIASVDTEPLQIVFGGGTALGRAHRLIRRMSEDIDLKIVSEEEPPRAALRRLREDLTEALLQAGFRFDPANPAHHHVGNQSRYTLYRLPYEPLLRGEGALRPEIRIEVAVWPLRRPAVHLPISSFVAEAFQRPAAIPGMACVAVTQTAADKFVALTRRTAAEHQEEFARRDATLVRHIYDLQKVAALARSIMPHDAEAFGNQYPSYRADPILETRRALEALQAQPYNAQTFAEFRRDMVYGETPSFEDALASIQGLGALLNGV